jgi:hypothetical protein
MSQCNTILSVHVASLNMIFFFKTLSDTLSIERFKRSFSFFQVRMWWDIDVFLDFVTPLSIVIIAHYSVFDPNSIGCCRVNDCFPTESLPFFSIELLNSLFLPFLLLYFITTNSKYSQFGDTVIHHH